MRLFLQIEGPLKGNARAPLKGFAVGIREVQPIFRRITELLLEIGVLFVGVFIITRDLLVGVHVGTLILEAPTTSL